MADRTTTLKTQTGDNVYPNIIGDNRNTAIADSATIKHSLADKKISFNLDNTTNNKITNSLQKPTGLTKTELVGVGTNGQENIEIGDNLTLANGKLSASASGGGVNILALNDNHDKISSGNIMADVINLVKIDASTSIVGSFTFNALVANGITTIAPEFDENNGLTGNLQVFMISQSIDGADSNIMGETIFTKHYSHFITIQSGSDLNINFNYYSTTGEAYTADTLITALAGKHVACSGYVVDGGTYQMAMEVTSSNGQLQFSSFDPSDGSTMGNSFSSLDVTDSVSAVE